MRSFHNNQTQPEPFERAQMKTYPMNRPTVSLVEGLKGFSGNKGARPDSTREHGNIVEIKTELGNIIDPKGKGTFAKKL